MTEPPQAVFLSYASQDAEAARRICEALRASGIEVWFDQSELRGGDAWDQKIRQQIHDCALFIPVISAHTEERTEGYFRLEWKLAVDRSHLMADDAAFLFPVVIDDTPDASARVPEKFRTLQWTRCPAGTTPAKFGPTVQALLAGTAKPLRAMGHAVPGAAISRRTAMRWAGLGAAGVLLIAAIAGLIWTRMARAPGTAASTRNIAASAAIAIPTNTIAVLPFEDVSTLKGQEYLSDGLAEALLNLLSKVPGLQVAARTSAFSFKGRDVDMATIGQQLKVSNVLRGSVSKVGNHLRVTAQLLRTDSDSPLWSQSYDRELGDVFRIQDDIAAAVVKALKVSYLGNTALRNSRTQNSEAYLVFLQGRAKMETDRLADYKIAATDFERALKLDPNYAPAYVELATAKVLLGEYGPTGDRAAGFEAATDEAKLLIEQALALDPDNAQAYIERGYLRAFKDRAGAEKDFRRGIELNPSSARGYGALVELIFDDLTRRDEALAMITRAQQLDPLEKEYDVLKARMLLYTHTDIRNADALLSKVVSHHPLYAPGWLWLADVRRTAGHYAEAIMCDEQALKLDPLAEWARLILIWNYIDVGDLAAARQVTDQAPHPLPIYRIQLLIQDADWRRAAEVSYAALAAGPLSAASEPHSVFALRMQARRTHDFTNARAAFETMCDVSWSKAGIPSFPSQYGFGYACVALGDMLIASGDRERGARLLRASVADMDYIAHVRKRGDVWYVIDRATAFALLGDRKAALTALDEAVHTGYINTWELLPLEPAFDTLRGEPEFQRLMSDMKAKMALERQNLERLRASGQVPRRGAPAPTPAASVAPPVRR